MNPNLPRPPDVDLAAESSIDLRDNSDALSNNSEDWSLTLPAKTGWLAGFSVGAGERALMALDWMRGSSSDPDRAAEMSRIIQQHRREYDEPTIWFWRRIVGAAFAFIVVTIVWFLIKLPDGLISDRSLPTQTQVASAFNEVRSQGFGGASLSSHAGQSLFRLIMGFGFGSLFGTILGVAIGKVPLLRTVVDPITSFLRMIPALALAPLMLIWFGIGETSMIVTVALVVGWSVMNATATSWSRRLRDEAEDLPLGYVETLRAALLIGWVSVVAVETVVATTGLGSMIWQAQARSDIIVVGIYVAGLIGFALDIGLRGAHYLLSRW